MNMDRGRREEIISEMVFAHLEGRLKLEDARVRYREFAAVANRMLPTSFVRGDIRSPVSLDAPIFYDSTTSRIETISEGLWT